MMEAACKSAQWLRLAVTFVWSQAGNIEKQLWELTGTYIKGVNFLSPLSLLLAYALLYSIWRANAAFTGLSPGGDVIFLERCHPLGSMCQDTLPACTCKCHMWPHLVTPNRRGASLYQHKASGDPLGCWVSP